MNIYGAWTLLDKEVKRFIKVYHQTIVAPIVSSLMWLAIFVLALGDINSQIQNIQFVDFVASGLIVMTIIQNAFANTSSSLIIAKVMGYIIDILIPPLSEIEIIIAYISGAIIRGIVVGTILWVVVSFITSLQVYHPAIFLYFTISAACFAGFLGFFTGIISSNFDQTAALTSYVVNPLSMLSGTFYSIDKLPEIVKVVNTLNPFFYIIDGFRYSVTNHHYSDITFGITYLGLMNIILFIIAILLLKSGRYTKN